MSPTHRIDLHSHFLPDFYQQALKDNGHANPDGMPGVPSWSPEDHLVLMDSLNIQKSVLSISTPGIHLVPSNPDLAVTLARQVNAYTSDLKKAHPTPFGYFATLPLPLIPESLSEIKTSLSEGADGFVLETNHHGIYLGDSALDPIFTLLNEHHALIFVHPTTPHVCPLHHRTTSTPPTEQNITNATPLATHYPNPMLEFFYDTSRALTHLYLSGTMARNPNLRFIFPHLGGAFAPMLSRWTTYSSLLPGSWERPVTQEEVVRDMLKRVWFDLAGVPFPNQALGLLEIFEEGRKKDGEKWRGGGKVVYGSDYPYTPAKGVEMLAKKMDEGCSKILDEDEVERVYHGNAEELLAMGMK